MGRASDRPSDAPRASDAVRGAHRETDAHNSDQALPPVSGALPDPLGAFQGASSPSTTDECGSSSVADDRFVGANDRVKPGATGGRGSGNACGHQETAKENEEEEEALPFLHPESARTSRWRKLMFELFTHESLKAQLEAGELWRLPRGLTSAQASAAFAKIYVSGACFGLKAAVIRTHWWQLAACWLLEMGSLAFATTTPLILYAVLQTAVSGEHRLLRLGTRLVLLYVTTLAEIVMHCHSRFLGFKINVQITGALRTLLFETTLGNGARVEQSWEGIRSFFCPEPYEEAPAARTDDSNHHSDDVKKRMAEVAHMYAHDVVVVAEVMTQLPVMWRKALQIMIQLYILVQVVGISATPIFIALAVIAVVLKLGSQFAGRVHKKLMRVVEARLNVLHECFKSIQMIKLNAWEDKMMHKVEHARSKESKLRRGVNVLRALQTCVGHESPNLASIMVFAWMAMQQEEFSPAQVFPALLLFRRIKDDFQSIMGLIDLTTAGHASFWKLSTYFSEYRGRSDSPSGATQSSRSPRTERQKRKSDTVVSMEQACFAPTADTTKPLLFNVTLSIPKGDLVVVQGKAGSGKSTLLSAILGDVESVYGDVFVDDAAKVAYCAQDAWLQTLSIRENILFGSALDERKYKCVLEACCLVDDLRRLPEGDATMVGPKGINLSGGQKARIALARACYADADLYLLDCPFASVDPVVQNEIFAKCVVDLLRYKTVVLVTHNPELSSSGFVDQLVTVDNMTAQVQTQTQTQLSGRRHDSGDGNKRFSRRTAAANSLPPWKRPTASPATGNDGSTLQPSGLQLWEPSAPLSAASLATLGRRTPATKDPCWSQSKTPVAPASMPSCSWFERKKASGAELDFFAHDKLRTFFNSSTMRYMLPGKLFLVLYATAATAKDIWLMSWSASSTPTKLDMLRSVNIYASLVVSSVVFGVLSTILHTKALALSANDLFHDMTAALVRAPMSFFYRTPVGEIFSRYFHDMRIADTEIVAAFLGVFRASTTIIASDVMVWYYTGFAGTGVLLIFVVAIKQFVSLGYAAALLQRAFQTEAANLNLISEALDGSTTIRAFGRAQVARFCAQHGAISDELLRGRYHAEAFKCFVLVRCDRVLGLHLVLLLVLLSTHKIAPAELGLLLYYLFTINSDVFTLTSQMLESIRYRFNIDRIVEYAAIAPEEAPLTPQQAQLEHTLPTPCQAPFGPSDAWPTKGDVVFEHVWFAYSARDSSQGALALQDVSFSVRGGEKIGVVGRTGSGKSSLAMALFRVHALQRGRILVDGVDVSTMRLDKLRRNVSILPQTPLFYRCSVRAYLDPFDEHDDDELWRVLTQCGLESSVRTLEGEMLADNGENWSAGERQQLCLARAALAPSRVVLLDESFSAVDQAGQAQLLGVLDSVFARSTVFLITHRLEEILAFDRVLVMRDGRAAEFGAADELAANPDSAFYEFLETTLLTF